MRTYWAIKIINGCRTWARVTTDYAIWASLPHVAAAIVGGCVVAAIIPPAYHHPPMQPMPEGADMPTPSPDLIYYPPGSPSNGPDIPRPVVYVPPAVPAPEPAGLLMLVVGIAGIVMARRIRT